MLTLGLQVQLSDYLNPSRGRKRSAPEESQSRIKNRNPSAQELKKPCSKGKILLLKFKSLVFLLLWKNISSLLTYICIFFGEFLTLLTVMNESAPQRLVFQGRSPIPFPYAVLLSNSMMGLMGMQTQFGVCSKFQIVILPNAVNL